MRQKQLRFIVTFHTTAEAMALEKLCRTLGIKGKLISAPRALSPDCGIAWRSPIETASAVKKAIAESGLEIHGFHEMEL